MPHPMSGLPTLLPGMPEHTDGPEPVCLDCFVNATNIWQLSQGTDKIEGTLLLKTVNDGLSSKLAMVVRPKTWPFCSLAVHDFSWAAQEAGKKPKASVRVVLADGSDIQLNKWLMRPGGHEALPQEDLTPPATRRMLRSEQVGTSVCLPCHVVPRCDVLCHALCCAVLCCACRAHCCCCGIHQPHASCCCVLICIGRRM